MRGVVLMIIAMLVIPPGIPAQDTGQPEQTDRFSKEELTQMLAPIALYPDSLTAQILMASTYPLEVVEAERWLKQNKNLKDDALNDALKEMTWDPSVKSLCHFPDVLMAMSDNLDQTRTLGDAFLSQEDEVMATIQELRQKAMDEGNLETTKEQQVIVENEIVRIEPADPEVIYVPVYDPFYVYGPWWYPAYPPYYWYYPPGFIRGGFIGFGPPIIIGIDIFSWVWFDWPFHGFHIDIDKTRGFHRHHGRRDSDKPFWEHDPAHRRGVAYRDRKTSERFGSAVSRVSPASRETRGYPGPAVERKGGQPAPGPGKRRGGTVVPQTGKAPEGAGRQGTVTPGVRPGGEGIQSPAVGDTPFRGVGSGNFERKAGERGGESLRGSQSRQPGGATGGRSSGQVGGSGSGGQGGGFRK